VNGRLEMTIVTLLVAGTPCLYGVHTKQEVRPRMTLVQCDMAGVDSEVLLLAKRETTRILVSAGVDILWVDAEPGCKVLSVNLCFIVVIMPKPPEVWNKPYATGTAPVRTGAYRRAYVFYDRVTAVAKAFTTNRRMETAGIILGHAVAHELGHLLIPGEAHSLNGIMRDQWNYRLAGEAGAGRLLFTQDQSKLIQRELQPQ
jgi:hypothetical protein